VEIEFGKTKLPHFDVPEGYDSWGYLNKLCTDGMKERYPVDDGTLLRVWNTSWVLSSAWDMWTIF